jgi:hypothetical protein
MNFTVTATLRNRTNFVCRHKQFDDVIEFLESFRSREISLFGIYLSLVLFVESVVPIKVPCITMGICTFRGNKSRFCLSGGGF